MAKFKIISEILSPDPIAINDFILKKSEVAIYRLVAPKECPIAASNAPKVLLISLIVSKNSGIIVVFPEDRP